MKTIKENTGEPVLTRSQRWLGLTVAAAMLLLLVFFGYHQVANTGFFTKFGPLEMAALYGPILVSLAAPVVRASTGRQNAARPLELVTQLLLAAGSLWLAIVFPFDFAHLTDIMPGPTRFVFSWITNDIGRVVLILQVLLSPITALMTAIQYITVRRQEADKLIALTTQN